MLYHLVKPDRKFDLKKDGVPVELMDKQEILGKLLNYQKAKVE